jgi:selenocysteine lyase/cysteine desulfurase
MPVELLTPRNEPLAGIVAFRHPRADEIHQKLRERNIHIMGNAGRLRVAVHGYNTSQDIETLMSTLSEILKSI